MGTCLSHLDEVEQQIILEHLDISALKILLTG